MAPSRSNRRDFLKGKAAAQALVQAVENFAEAVAPDEPGNGQHNSLKAGSPSPTENDAHLLLHLTRRAMACDFQVYLNAERDSAATEQAMAALDLIEQLEDQLTVYRDHSEVSRINQTAAREPISVESRLFDLLQTAGQLFEATGGAYDITSGPLSKAWGFYRRQGRIPTADELSLARERTGGKFVQLDSQRQTIRFTQPGLEINLGSIGKGYALDRAAELLRSDGVTNFVLHGGNSSVIANGHNASEQEHGGWLIGLRHPWQAEKRLGTFRLKDRCLGTSGSEAQFFLHDGKRYGHILDPRSGHPAEGVLTATVIAPSCALADALATAFYVLGPSGAEFYCSRHPGISAILVTPGPRSGAIEIHRYNVPAEELSLS